jgi:hypothetical protein
VDDTKKEGQLRIQWTGKKEEIPIDGKLLFMEIIRRIASWANGCPIYSIL